VSKTSLTPRGPAALATSPVGVPARLRPISLLPQREVRARPGFRPPTRVLPPAFPRQEQ